MSARFDVFSTNRVKGGQDGICLRQDADTLRKRFQHRTWNCINRDVGRHDIQISPRPAAAETECCPAAVKCLRDNGTCGPSHSGRHPHFELLRGFGKYQRLIRLDEQQNHIRRKRHSVQRPIDNDLRSGAKHRNQREILFPYVSQLRENFERISQIRTSPKIMSVKADRA